MIEVRRGRDSDKEQVVQLIGKVFGAREAERTERRWHWQWHLDPRLPAQEFQGVVAQWQGQLIATLATIPAALHVNGKPVAAHWAAAACVNWGLIRKALKEERRHKSGQKTEFPNGIVAALMDFASRDEVQLTKHTAEPMLAIQHKMGMEEIPDTGEWGRSVSYRGSVEHLIGRPLAKAVSAIADLTLPSIPRSSLRVQPLGVDFDARFDRFWERLQATYEFIGRRDAAVLNWRYRQHPDITYNVLIIEDAGELQGYAVFSCYRSGKHWRSKIVDTVVLPGDQEAYKSLMAAALRELRRRGVKRVEYYNAGFFGEDSLVQLGFKHKKRPDPMMARHLPSVKKVYVGYGDGDGG